MNAESYRPMNLAVRNAKTEEVIASVCVDDPSLDRPETLDLGLASILELFGTFRRSSIAPILRYDWNYFVTGEPPG